MKFVLNVLPSRSIELHINNDLRWNKHLKVWEDITFTAETDLKGELFLPSDKSNLYLHPEICELMEGVDVWGERISPTWGTPEEMGWCSIWCRRREQWGSLEGLLQEFMRVGSAISLAYMDMQRKTVKNRNKQIESLRKALKDK